MNALGRISICIGIAIIAIASGCTVGPDYAPPQTTVPVDWSSASPSEPAAERTSQPTTEGPVNEAWWTTFDDPTLDSLIEHAVRANPDLKLAEARVREARAQRGVVAADKYPTIDATGSYSRNRYSENSFGFGPGIETSLYTAGFDAAWELDIFGHVSRSVEAADADTAAMIEDRRAVLVTLQAEVARSYVELRGTQRKISIAQANLLAQQETLTITQRRRDVGLIGNLDVARAAALVETTQSLIPGLERDARLSIHAISVLLGMVPAALVPELSSEGPLPTLPDIVPIGLPSDLLRRRPDIRRAERQLAAATARIGMATADLFPRFSLTGSLGLESSQFNTLTNLGSGYWSIGPSMRWPVLDWGRVRSNIQVQSSREEQAFITYESTILTGLREVEDALVSFARNQERLQNLRNAVESNRQAVDLARDLYTQGLSDFLSVLQAQRDLFVTEEALANNEIEVATDLVSLYKSLGGGWSLETQSEPEDAGTVDSTDVEAGQRKLNLTSDL